MRILVCGLGSIGRRHGRNFRALGVDDIVGFDPDPERRQQFASEVGAPVIGDLEQALANKPDLVAVTSPNRFHMEQAISAAKAGSHLFIEKPLSHNTDRIDELLSLIASKKLFAHVGSNFKFHPAFIEMKRLIDTGAIGRITGAQVIAGQWLPDWHPWEDYRRMYSSRKDLGGGVLLDTHELIYLCWLLGAVKSTSGKIAHSGALQIETEDVAAVCLRFERGTLATLLLDYIQRDPRRRYHLSGEAGTIEWDIKTPSVTHYDAATRTTSTIPAALADINDMYVEQSRHILAGVQGREKPRTTVEEARAALEISLSLKAAYD